MPTEYQVKNGDCISSIAFNHGFFRETLWNHGNNADLKRKRKDPNVLMEGDMVHIPNLTLGWVAGESEERHRFTLRGVPAKLRMRFLRDGKPIRNARVVFTLDGRTKEAETNGDGFVEVFVPPHVREASAAVGEGDALMHYILNPGWLDPADTVIGAQHRLSNLGRYAGPYDGEASPEFTAALQTFQAEHELTIEGTLTRATADKLKEAHGS